MYTISRVSMVNMYTARNYTRLREFFQTITVKERAIGLAHVR